MKESTFSNAVEGIHALSNSIQRASKAVERITKAFERKISEDLEKQIILELAKSVHEKDKRIQELEKMLSVGNNTSK